MRLRERDENISGVDANRILDRLEADPSSSLPVQPSTPAVTQEATRMIDGYPLGADDVIQLAAYPVVRTSCGNLALDDVWIDTEPEIYPSMLRAGMLPS